MGLEFTKVGAFGTVILIFGGLLCIFDLPKLEVQSNSTNKFEFVTFFFWVWEMVWPEVLNWDMDFGSSC